MADQRRGKRKSPCADFIEVDELDLSPENSISDPIEPDAKIPKTGNNGFSLASNVDILPNLKPEPKVEVEVINKSDQEEITTSEADKKVVVVENEKMCQAGEPQSDIVVKFRNAETAKLYRDKFQSFLESLVQVELVRSGDGLTLAANRDGLLKEEDCVLVNTPPESQEVSTSHPAVTTLQDTTLPLPIPPSPGKKRKKKSKAKKELFVVDTNPSLRTHQLDLQYSSKFVIEDKTEESQVSAKKKGPMQQECFNCGQSHSLRDCPLPKDFAKIRNARQKFSEKMANRTSRYHLEEDQKYGHLTPGKISEELRDALGLRTNEMPPYIYKMRILGYPPGWLEEAKFIHSNLNMFDIHGNNVRHSLKKNRGLDPEKIVDYPGFNVPPEKGSRDDYKKFGVQPYSRQFSKEIMLDYFEKEYAKNQDDFETCDMDVDDNGDNQNDESMVENNSEDDSEQKDSKYNVQPAKAKENPPSPSLIDLEQKKKDLLAQLDDSTSSKPGTPCVEEVSIVEEKGVVKTVAAIDLTSDDQSQSTSESELCDLPKCDTTTASNTSMCLNSSLNIVKETSFGTPILKSSSPYARVPNADNFMKDVSPVINFENLPNSTGKYEQMSGVIQKVRSALKNIQKCKT